MISAAEVAESILAGSVAVIPTDTVYGLAAHPGIPSAVERLYSIKERDRKKPIALLVSDESVPAKLGFHMPPKALDAVQKFWPGALTIVLEKDGTTEAFRCPDHDWTRELLSLCGGALRVTSANMSGEIPAVEAAKAFSELGLKADIIVDGGKSRIGVASTVAAFSADGSVKILRQGPIAL